MPLRTSGRTQCPLVCVLRPIGSAVGEYQTFLDWNGSGDYVPVNITTIRLFSGGHSDSSVITTGSLLDSLVCRSDICTPTS